MQKVITNPAARDKNKTCTNSLVRYLMLSCLTIFYGNATKPSFLPLCTSQPLAGLAPSSTTRRLQAGRARSKSRGAD
jgi:hypothetical protein